MADALEFAGSSRFRVVRRIGAGGMGVVYEAIDREHGGRVALKTLRQLDANGLYRFKNEFRAVESLRHPNLVSLGELVEHEGRWFFTMELIEGSDILRHIAEPSAGSEWTADTVPPEPGAEGQPRSPVRSPADEHRLRAAMGQLALGLATLHRAGIVHRDVKPSNVLVTRTGRVVLVDFGLMTWTDERRSAELHVVGTVHYMAPEQAAQRPITPAADWYSFGVLLYEALTGRLPFRGTAMEILMDKQQFAPPRPASLAPLVPEDLDALCVELLRFGPKDRPSERRILERLGMDLDDKAQSAASQRSRFTQTVPFVGRAREMAVLEAALAASRAGKTVSVVVAGESGTGKSELVHRFLEAVAFAHPETLVFSGRCFERETVPYKAFDGIADSIARHLVRLPPDQGGSLLPRRAALLGKLFPVLRRADVIANAPLAASETQDPHELRARMFGALREFLQRLADRNPLVLHIDDFQWADADSLALIRELMFPPDPPPLLLLVTMRTDGSGGRARVLEAARSLVADTRHIELDRLPPDEAQELVALVAPQLVRNRPDLAELIAREADGHPLFILELVRHAEDDATTVGTISLEDALAARIGRLSTAARELLEVLSVAGAPISHEIAAQASQLEASEYERTTAILRVGFFARTAGTRSVDTIEPYHDRVRDAVLARLAPAQRTRQHLRLALALERGGAAAAQPQALVRHLEAAGENDRAAQLAEQAAERAGEAFAFDLAADLYRSSVRLGGHRPDKVRLLMLRLGQALANAGHGAEAADALLAAADGADPVTRLECRRQAAEQLLFCGHLDRGFQAINELLAEIGAGLPRSSQAALARLLLSRARLRLRGMRWQERHEKEIAASDLLRIDVLKAAAMGLNLADPIRSADFQARCLLASLKTGEPARIARAIAHEAMFLASQGERARRRASKLLVDAKTIAVRLDAPYLALWVNTAEGLIAYFAGRFAESASFLDESEKIILERTVGTTWELNSVRLFRIFNLRHMGEHERLRAMTDEYMRDAVRRGDFLNQTSVRRVQNMLCLAAGRPDLARLDLEKESWRPPDGSFHLQHWYELESRAELALYEQRVAAGLGDLRERFVAMDGSLLQRVQIVRAVACWLRGRLALAAAVAGDAASLAACKREIDRLAADDASYSHVWSALLLAGWLHRKGRDVEAIAKLELSESLAQVAQMHDCASAARLRRGQLVGGAAGAKLVAEAEKACRGRGITDVAGWMRVISPGFAPDGGA